MMAKDGLTYKLQWCFSVLLSSLVVNSWALGHPIDYGPNPSYDQIPITSQTWKEVDLVYFITLNHKRYANHIELLRPVKWLERRHMDKIGGNVTLSIPEFGVKKVVATVLDAESVHINHLHVAKKQYVIGRFQHYVTAVRTYTFRDEYGKVMCIHATPNHPFYVKNQHAFVPVQYLSSHDQLMGMDGAGDLVHLVCAKGRQDHCGTPYNKHRGPISVYNLEIYQRHTYRIGSEGVIVHNGCDQDANTPFNVRTRRFQYYPVSTRDPVTLDENLDVHDPEVMRLVTVDDEGKQHVEGYYHRSSITNLQDNLSPTSRRLIVGFLHSNGNIEEILPNPGKLSMMDR